MYIASQQSYVTVTFDTLVDARDVLDEVHYRIVGGEGAVPVSPIAVEAIPSIAVLQGTSVLAGGSSVKVRSPTWTSLDGGAGFIGLAQRLMPAQASMGASSGFHEGAEVEPPVVAPSPVLGVRLTINKPTGGATYRLEVLGLRTAAGARYEAVGDFVAVLFRPRVEAAQQLDAGQVVVTFSDRMRIDVALLSPNAYSITGPTKVLTQAVQTVADNQVMLATVGLGSGQYTLEVSETLQDIAGNSVDPNSDQAGFTGSPPVASRSVFTDHGPISKPELVLQSGSTASISSAVQISLPGASLTAALVGLYLKVSNTTNAGRYRITSIVSATVARVAASFSVPDVADGSIGWSIVDPRDGMIADAPADVTVTINGARVTPEAVVGLLGQVVLPMVPDPSDTVLIDYSWIQNPVVDFRRLNSREFRLNNWNRDNGRPTDLSAHKYRYNNTLIQPENFVALDLRAELAQPRQRDLKYRAYERAYSVALNDPNLLLLNSPNHRIAFPPMSRPLESTFVNYEGKTLPEAAPDPWMRHGVGQAVVSGTDLLVTDDSTGSFPAGNPIFWTRPIDLTFDHVFAIAWRMRIVAVANKEGVFTGVAAGYSDARTAVIVGFLDAGNGPQFGILKRGFGNDPSSSAAWTGGLDSSNNPTGAPANLDWAVLRGYRIFRDRSGMITVYIDGAVVPLLRCAPDELPYLEELNAPFNELQGPFFGSLSRDAKNASSWNFVRYTAVPINPLQAAPSLYVAYEGTTPPESASQPWTPIGFHGTETILTGTHLLLDSTSATDLPSSSAAGLIGGDFKGYSRIEPLLSESFDTLLEINAALRTHTHGITPNALMAAIDDGDRLIQLSFLADKAYPKFSYGGRALPPDFAPYDWVATGAQNATMVGQYLQITDASTSDGLVYSVDDQSTVDDSDRVVGYKNEYMLEFRVNVLSYTPDPAGFVGVMSSVYDSSRAVGVQLTEVGQRYVELHSDGQPVAAGRFAFDWFGDFHTFRLVKAKAPGGDEVSLFVDSTFLSSVPYSSFATPSPSLTGIVSFGSSTPSSQQAMSVAVWAYSNYWRFDGEARKFVGLWKGRDPNSLTGYHLPVSVTGHAAVNGNVLTDSAADFVASGVMVGDQLVIDEGLNKGAYEVTVVAPDQDVTKLTVSAFPSQPSEVGYRVIVETDWSSQHRYRIRKDPSGGVTVLLDSIPTPFIHADYSNTALPPSSVGIPRSISSGLPSVMWGAFDPSNLSQSSWDYVRLSALRSISERGIVPHHQILNQRNVIASYEHHRTNIRHQHTDFWSESEGIPPQTEPDLLRDPNLVAFTLLNDGTPLVPSTQTFAVRSPTPVLVPVAGLNRPEGIVLNGPGSVLNNAEQQVQILVPDDVLYNSLEVIEGVTGEADLIAPFDDESQPSFGPLYFQKEVCLSYDGSVLPENDVTAATPWFRVSDDAAHQFANAFSGVLTYGTDDTGTRTLYRNSTPLPDSIGLRTEVKFRLKLLQDSSLGLGDSGVRVGFSSPGVTVGLAFVTTPLGQRYVLAVDLNNGQTVGGIAFDFYDGAYHDYRLVRDPVTASVQIFIDA